MIRGGGQVGPLFATWPFASLRISRNELRIRWPFGSETVTRRDGGRLELDERALGTSVRLVDDRGRGSIRLTPWRPDSMLEALVAYGWQTERRTR